MRQVPVAMTFSSFAVTGKRTDFANQISVTLSDLRTPRCNKRRSNGDVVTMLSMVSESEWSNPALEPRDLGHSICHKSKRLERTVWFGQGCPKVFYTSSKEGELSPHSWTSASIVSKMVRTSHLYTADWQLLAPYQLRKRNKTQTVPRR